MKKPNLDKLDGVLERVSECSKQRKIFLAQKSMWAEIKKQGIKIQDVKDLGWSKWIARGVENPENEPWYDEVVLSYRGRNSESLWYNYAIMKNGTRKVLKPFIKVPPGFDNPNCTKRDT